MPTFETVVIQPEGLPGSTEGPWEADVYVWHGEDWYDPLEIVDINGNPFNLAGCTLEWFARPAFDHSTRLVRLYSPAGGIIIENAALGLAAISYTKENVELNLPVNIDHRHWEQFLRLTFTDPDLGAIDRHLFLGKLFVMPAKEAA